MDSQIRLTIKAANGLVDDFAVDAQSNWTIHQLKNHLYRHYSTHPPQTSQKLIHGGRLLLDQQTLQEAIPNLLNIENVVIHLVAYERSASAPSGLSSLSTEGPRQTVSRSSSRPTASRQPSLTPVQENSLEELAPQETRQASTAQEAPQPPSAPAAPQHGSQPWLRYRGGMMPPNAQMYQVPGMGMGQVQNFPMYMPMGGYPFPPQFYMTPYGAAYANHMAQWYNNYGRQPPPSGVGGNLSGEGLVEREEDIDLPNPQNMGNNNEEDVDNDVQAMNAGALGMMAGGGVNFQNHRDFVDYLYMFIMAAFLALIAYITGSFGRLLIFAGGIMFMLLNQAGWFSLQRRRPVRQPVEQNPLVRARAEQQQQHQQQVVQPETEQEDQGRPHDEQRTTEESDDSSQAPSPPPTTSSDESAIQQPPQQQEAVNQQLQQPAPPPLAEERPGLLATLFVFVTSFFTSLIPQQRPELQIN